MKDKQNQKLLKLTFSGLFAAIITIFIYLVHIPYGNTGYVHLGDTMIFLCASFLPTPYAVAAAAIGGGFADFLSGYPVYIIPTMLAKGLIALTFSAKDKKLLTKRNIIACVASFGISLAVYAVAEFIFGLTIYGLPVGGALTTAATTLLQNSIQALASTALYVAVALALDKAGIKGKFGF